jgi:hypothetical protein
MHLDVVIERVWRCTWKLWSWELRGCNGVTLVEYLDAVYGRLAGCSDSVHQLVNSQTWECDKLTLPMRCHGELGDCG